MSKAGSVSKMHIFLTHLSFGTYVEQILQNRIRLILGHALDSACETFVDEDALPSGHSCSLSVFRAIGFEGSVSHDLFGSQGGLPLMRSLGSTAIREESFVAGFRALPPLRGRTLHHGQRSRSPRRRPLLATSGRRFRTWMPRADNY